MKIQKLGFIGLTIMICLGMASQGLAEDYLLINSYNKGFPWTDGITAGYKEMMGDMSSEIYYMNTKVPGITASQLKKAGDKAIDKIRISGAKVVAISDDNAAKYVVLPYLSRYGTEATNVKFVFCGTNWSVSGYGFDKPPFRKLVTGMIEVSRTDSALKGAAVYNGGGDIFWSLAFDTPSNRKDSEKFANFLGLTFANEIWVKTLDEWIAQYRSIMKQKKATAVYLGHFGGFETELATQYKKILGIIHSETTIPTVTTMEETGGFALYSLAKSPKEQGLFVGKASLMIGKGTSPEIIPIVKNSRNRLLLNTKLAAKIGISFSVDDLQAAMMAGDIFDDPLAYTKKMMGF